MQTTLLQLHHLWRLRILHTEQSITFWELKKENAENC